MLKHLKTQDDWSEKSLGAKGFTLIELLVVIIILGILAAVVVFSVQGISDNGDKSACEAETRTIETAVETYRARYGNYPAGKANLIGDFLREDPGAEWTVSGATVNGPDCDNL